jgi:hypothetical protein
MGFGEKLSLLDNVDDGMGRGMVFRLRNRTWIPHGTFDEENMAVLTVVA